MSERGLRRLLREAEADPGSRDAWRRLADAARRAGRAPPGLVPRRHLADVLAVADPAKPELQDALVLPMLGLATDLAAPARDPASGLPRATRRRVDGAAMCLVPAGPAILGSNDGFPGHLPARRVRLPAFYIDRLPVAVSAWARFVREGGGRAPLGAAAQRETPENPVVGISWRDAREYAAWVGARLPWECEWEKAARGETGRPFPWGDAPPDPSRANYQRRDPPDPADPPVEISPGSARPAGASPYGVLDLVGNAGEWCADRAVDLDTQGGAPGRVVRGGRFKWSRQWLYTWTRARAAEARRNREVGFRLVIGLGPPGPPVRARDGEPVPDRELPFEARGFPGPAEEEAWFAHDLFG